jgi:hypothetical protein
VDLKTSQKHKSANWGDTAYSFTPNAFGDWFNALIEQNPGEGHGGHLTQPAIAQALGVGIGTVRTWCKPVKYQITPSTFTLFGLAKITKLPLPLLIAQIQKGSGGVRLTTEAESLPDHLRRVASTPEKHLDQLRAELADLSSDEILGAIAALARVSR